MEHEGDDDTSCNWYTRSNPQKLTKKIERLINQRTSRDHPEYGIMKIDRNTKKSPGDLKRLAISQTPGLNHPLTLVWKALKLKRNSFQIIITIGSIDLSIYLWWLNIHGFYMTANNSTNNNVVFHLFLNLKIVYYNNY